MWLSSCPIIMCKKDYSCPIELFGILVENHLAINFRVNFWILNSNLLPYMSVPMLIPNQILREHFLCHLAYYQSFCVIKQIWCSGMSLTPLLWRWFASRRSLWPAEALLTLWHDGIVGLQRSFLLLFSFSQTFHSDI